MGLSGRNLLTTTHRLAGSWIEYCCLLKAGPVGVGEALGVGLEEWPECPVLSAIGLRSGAQAVAASATTRATPATDTTRLNFGTHSSVFAWGIPVAAGDVS